MITEELVLPCEWCDRPEIEEPEGESDDFFAIEAGESARSAVLRRESLRGSGWELKGVCSSTGDLCGEGSAESVSDLPLPRYLFLSAGTSPSLNDPG